MEMCKATYPSEYPRYEDKTEELKTHELAKT